MLSISTYIYIYTFSWSCETYYNSPFAIRRDVIICHRRNKYMYKKTNKLMRDENLKMSWPLDRFHVTLVRKIEVKLGTDRAIW